MTVRKKLNLRNETLALNFSYPQKIVLINFQQHRKPTVVSNPSAPLGGEAQTDSIGGEGGDVIGSEPN